MTGQSDDYLAQMERALERIEATTVDADLARAHAPHLVPPAAQPAVSSSNQAPSEAEKFNLGANLLQSDVDVSLSPANDIGPAFHEPVVDSGLGLQLAEDARAIGESLSDLSMQAVPEAEFDLEASMPMEGKELVAESSLERDAAPKLLRLETQAPKPGGGTPSGQYAQSSMAGAAANARSSRASMGASRASNLGPGRMRRGLFSPHLGVNLLVSLGIATWLALLPTKMLTEHWLREGSHVGLTQLQESMGASSLSPAERRSLADGLLLQAGAAQGRFLWTWAMIAMAGTIVLSLPYRRGY